MKSKTSLFDAGIFKNLLKRFWPVFLVYFIVLFSSLPGTLAAPGAGLGYCFSWQILWQATRGVQIAAVAGAGFAMCTFFFMFTLKGTGMMASLPVKRETLFMTSYLAGIVPMIAINILTCLFALVYEASHGAVYMSFLLTWLEAVTLADIFYYSFACFVAQLTGSLFVLPAVYAVLLMTFAVAEQCVTYLFDVFLYGYAPGESKLSFLSPPAYLDRKVVVESFDPLYDYNSVRPMVCSLKGMGILAVYALVGLVFAYLALRLYRKRRMETATDVVSVEILKPIFKYCLAAGCALVAAQYFGSNFISEYSSNISKLALVLFIMLIAAFIGYFAAEMLMKKSARVFADSWKGFVPVACVIVLFCTLLNADITGFEEKIPEAGEVESVQHQYSGTTLEEAVNIERTLEGHRAIVRNRLVISDPSNTNISLVRISYNLKNGKKLTREYTLVEDGTQDANLAFESAVNSTEGKHFRFAPLYALTEDPDYVCNLNVSWYDPENARYEYDYMTFTGDRLREFADRCLKPDLESSSLGDIIFFYSDKTREKLTTIGIDIYEQNKVAEVYDNYSSVYMYMQVSTDAEHTLSWIRNNTPFIIISQAENDANIPAAEGWATDGNAVYAIYD